jgi:endogenous inhibitor of DNA gyrase (YacG/DUF329 family)
MRHPEISNCPICGIPMTQIGIFHHLKAKHPEITVNEYKSKYLGWNVACDICGEMFPTEKKMIRHKQFRHNFKTEKYLSRENHVKNLPMNFVCEICKKPIPNKNSLTKHIKKFHPEVSLIDYYIKYLNPENPTMKCLECGTPVKFRGLASGFAKFCSFSCSTKWFAQNTNRISDAMETLKAKKIENPDYQLHPAQIRYWILKGFTEEQAREKVSERQKTFSLKKCIEKYGEIEGKKRWKLRQERWINNYKKRNFSKISQQLFWSIYEKMPESLKPNIFFAENDNGIKDETGKNHEYKMETSKSFVKLDFYIPCLNYCLEFDGDYWHGDKCNNGQVNKARNENRDIAIKEQNPGIILVHIKEKDYKADKETVTNDVIKDILYRYGTLPT